MTGRDLIIYILQNGLENEEVFKDGKFIGFKTMDEVAVELGVGTATVEAWCKLRMMKYVTVGDLYLIPGDYTNPLENKNE